MTTLIWYGVITGALLLTSTAIHFSKKANGRLPGCLRWEEPYYGRHARTEPRQEKPRATWRDRLPRWWDWPLVQRWYTWRYRRADRKAFAQEMELVRDGTAPWLRELAAADAPGEGTAPDTPAPGAVPLDIRATASGGFPAVGFRPGKQPWETAGQPRLPEMMPAPHGASE